VEMLRGQSKLCDVQQETIPKMKEATTEANISDFIDINGK